MGPRALAGIVFALAALAMPEPSAAKALLVTIPAEPQAETYRDFRRPPRYSGGPRVDALLDELARVHGLRREHGWAIRALDVHCEVFDAPGDVALEPLIARLRADPRIDDAQPMLVHRTRAPRYADPMLRAQHAFRALRLQAVHDVTRGDGATVAIVDSGIDRAHPDLHGHVERRADFTDGRAAGAHGTAVAGLIAAQPGNGIGIVGVAPGARLLDLKACWAERPATPLDSVCDTLSLARALDAAIAARTDVINLSLGGPHDPLLDRLITHALARGISVVAAAGAGEFPGTRPDVISVAGDASRATSVVAVPAQGLLTTFPDGAYDYVSGDSFAAAQVAGVVALVRTRHPAMTPHGVRAAVIARPLDVVALVETSAAQAATVD